MAKKIQMWAETGPRIAPTIPLEAEEIINTVVQTTNQSRGSLLAALAEIDVAIENGLKSGRIVKLPNGTTLRPIGKKDGSIKVSLRLNPRIINHVNQEFKGKWLNAANIDKTEAEMIAQWNKDHPDDLVEN